MKINMKQFTIGIAGYIIVLLANLVIFRVFQQLNWDEQTLDGLSAIVVAFITIVLYLGLYYLRTTPFKFKLVNYGLKYILQIMFMISSCLTISLLAGTYMGSYRVANIFLVIISCYYLLSLVSIISIKLTDWLQPKFRYRTFIICSIVILVMIQMVVSILIDLGINIFGVFVSSMLSYILYWGILQLLIIGYVLVANYYQLKNLDNELDGLELLAVSHNSMLDLLSWPYFAYLQMKVNNQSSSSLRRFNMHSLLSVSYLIVAVIDLNVIISSYQLQHTLCEPANMTGQGLTEISCMGANYQLSILHLMIVIAALVIFNITETTTFAKLVILITLIITIDMFIAIIFIYPLVMILIVSSIIYVVYNKLIKQ